MYIFNKSTILALTMPVFCSMVPTVVLAEEPPCPFNENRSGICGHYHSEISPAEAYLGAVANRDKKDFKPGKQDKSSKHLQRPVIIDVRSTPEYKAGHPEHAYNVPYPYIYQYCNEEGRSLDGACMNGGERIAQNDEDFVKYVESIVSDKDAPVYTLCRTGVRSVGAANILTDAGYTHVRNIWEGFVGVNLTAPKVQADGSVAVLPVDLNHDGQLTEEDKNGWRNHQGLPYDTRLLRQLVYRPYAYLYDLAD